MKNALPPAAIIAVAAVLVLVLGFIAFRIAKGPDAGGVKGVESVSRYQEYSQKQKGGGYKTGGRSVGGYGQGQGGYSQGQMGQGQGRPGGMSGYPASYPGMGQGQGQGR